MNSSSNTEPSSSISLPLDFNTTETDESNQQGVNWFALVLVLSLLVMMVGYRCYSWAVIRSER